MIPQEILHTNQTNNHEKTIISSTLLNIDSSFRNIKPKHIYNSNNFYLSPDPIEFIQNSNIITINYPNHDFVIGDNIIIQNVTGIIKILHNALYLVNNLKYVILNIENNEISINYTNYIDKLYTRIELVGKQNTPYFINNITFNSLIGIKVVFLANDILINDNVKKLAYDLYNSFDEKTLNTKFLFIELYIPYVDLNNNNYFLIKDIFKISYLHINGISLGYLNANYPINDYYYQSSYMISNIVNANQFQITLNYKSYNSNMGGGNNIQIYKILNSLIGYPDSNNYVINLKKTFNNVIDIELVSTELPYVDIVVKYNINDKLYWKHIEDGNYIYTIQLDEGFYTPITLYNSLKLKMNAIPRINSYSSYLIYNNFDIDFEAEIHKITFKPYNLTNLPNCLSIRLNSIDNDQFYILNVNHKNNLVDINDYITISNCTNVTFRDSTNVNQINSIDASYFNKIHKVYAINLENQTYDIILGKKTEITITLTNYDSAGGENIIVKSKTKVSFLFNKSDTLGVLLGFLNVASDYAITDFKSEISNDETYINTINLNSVGNTINYTNGFFNLSGNYNYILMYINDIEYLYSNNDLAPAFAKILLTGNPGDILFNTFVQQPKNIYSKSFPIMTLSDIAVSFVYPDGTPINFRNLNHSFTLKITEEKIQNNDTYINSNIISIKKYLN